MLRSSTCDTQPVVANGEMEGVLIHMGGRDGDVWHNGIYCFIHTTIRVGVSGNHFIFIFSNRHVNQLLPVSSSCPASKGNASATKVT